MSSTEDLLSPKDRHAVEEKIQQKREVMAVLSSHYKLPAEYFLDMAMDDPMLKAYIDVVIKQNEQRSE